MPIPREHAVEILIVWGCYIYRSGKERRRVGVEDCDNRTSNRGRLDMIYGASQRRYGRVLAPMDAGTNGDPWSCLQAADQSQRQLHGACAEVDRDEAGAFRPRLCPQACNGETIRGPHAASLADWSIVNNCIWRKLVHDQSCSYE